MTIDPLVDPTLAVITGASAREEVRLACDDTVKAFTTLRFHEGLRRGWEEARAEASVREATAIAIMCGARTNVDDMRIASMNDASRSAVTNERTASGATRDPAMDLALGIWRSQANLRAGFDPLNTRVPTRKTPRPLPALIAGLHRDACSGLVESGRLDVGHVAIPHDAGALAYAMTLINGQLPALVKAACLVAHFRFRTVFDPASSAVGYGLARWLLVTQGVEPTGVAVISAFDAENQAEASRALGGWVGASEESVARWLVHSMRTFAYGAKVGADIAFHVQAGRLS